MKKFICLTAILSLVCVLSSCSKDDKDSEFKDVLIEVQSNFGKKFNPEFTMYVTCNEEDLIIDKSEWDSYEYSKEREFASLKLKKKSISESSFRFKTRNSIVVFYVDSKKNEYEYEDMDILIRARVNGEKKVEESVENVNNKRILFHVD